MGDSAESALDILSQQKFTPAAKSDFQAVEVAQIGAEAHEAPRHVAVDYYHKGHTWARIEHGGFVRVGIDDFALRLLGHPTGMDLPRIGSRLNQSTVGWAFRRDEKTADMLAPVSGMVMAVNHRVWIEPETAKKDPYGQGWLLVLEPKGLKKSLKGLLTDQGASQWIAQEAGNLEDMVMKTYGLSLAATGGEVVDDIFGNLSHLGWEELVHVFLHT